MATTLASRTQLLSVTTITGSDDDFGPDSTQHVFPFDEGNLTDGSSAGQANKFYKGKLTVPAGGSETLDLGDGSLEFQGTSVDFSRVVKFVAHNANDVEGDEILMGDAPVNPWEGWTTEPGATVVIGPGGCVMLYDPSAAGMSVNGSLSSQLLFTNLNTSHAITLYVEITGS